MSHSIALRVLADPPLPGRCLPNLGAGYAPEWSAGLYAAMLRDTLDGLQSVDAAAHATDYVVLSSCDDDDEEGRAALARRLPLPWTVRTESWSAPHWHFRPPAAASCTILAPANAPTAPIDLLVDLLAREIDRPFAAVGAGDHGRAWLAVANAGAQAILEDLPWAPADHDVVATLRARCAAMAVPLHELPHATIVAEPADVVSLLEELRRHPERAPRTAQFLVTRS